MKRDRHLDERGVMFAWLILMMGATLGLTAIGPGVGRLMLAANEVQIAADAAALAGGMAMFENTSPEADALVVLHGNRVENRHASLMLKDIDEGYYDSDTFHFEPGGIPRNAVRAIVATEVQNPFGAMILRKVQYVEKIAYAGLTGLRGGTPTLPVAIGECYFDTECYAQSCMPALAQVPSTDDNSGWTAFSLNASKTNILSFVPEPCGEGDFEELTVGDDISLNNGQVTPILNAMECLIDYGMLQHLVPIVPCDGNFNQTGEVLGFATIELEAVDMEGGEQGVALKAVFKTDVDGTSGGTNFGSNNLVLVPVDS